MRTGASVSSNLLLIFVLSLVGSLTNAAVGLDDLEVLDGTKIITGRVGEGKTFCSERKIPRVYWSTDEVPSRTKTTLLGAMTSKTFLHSAPTHT